MEIILESSGSARFSPAGGWKRCHCMANIGDILDTGEAGLGLKHLKWAPFNKGGNGMNVVTFRSRVEGLMRRAGKADALQRIRAIRNCRPVRFKEETGVVESEEKLWKNIHWGYITIEIGYNSNPHV